MNKQKVFISGLVIILLIFAGPKTIQYFRYNKADGTVVRINKGIFHGLASRTTFYYPTIYFKDNTGNEASYAKNNEVLYITPSVGDKITVIYNPDNPEEKWLSTFGSYWFSLPDMMIAALCCIAWYGIVNIIFVKPRKKKAVVQKNTP